MVRRVAFVLLAVVAAGCANVLGLGDYGDATGDGGAGAPGGGEAGAPSSFTLPAGWSVVAFADGARPACPTGFAGQPPADLSGGTPDTTRACACEGCTILTPPTCVKGPIAVSFDINGTKTCDTPYQGLANANPGGCNTDNFHGQIASGYDIKLTPPGPSGGTCSGAAAKHEDRVAFPDQARVCPADSAQAAGCSGDTCAPHVPSPFAACLAHAGNVACPDGPFSAAHHLASGATFDCAATCTCTVSATCTNEVVTYYGDGMCGGPGALPVPATGACVNQGGNGAAYGSYKLTATATPTCTATGGSTATNVATAGDQTVCCAP